MKKLILFFVLFIFWISGLNAQTSDSTNFKFSSAEICSGKGAVTSGLYGYATFENKNSSVMLTLSADDNEITYLRKLKGNLLCGVNAGYWFNVPYISTQAIWNPVNFFGTFHWVGAGFGEPGEKIGNPRFFFAVNQATVSLKNFSGSYTLIHYMKNPPQHVVNIKYSQKVNKNFSLYTSVGYDLTKKNQLLQLGIIYKK